MFHYKDTHVFIASIPKLSAVICYNIDNFLLISLNKLPGKYQQRDPRPCMIMVQFWSCGTWKLFSFGKEVLLELPV